MTPEAIFEDFVQKGVDTHTGVGYIPHMEPTTTTRTEEAPMATWPYTQPCGCNLETGYCPTHQPMVQDLHAAYNGLHGDDTFHACGRLADGFGAPGVEYGDWSAWRDSTPAAIEAMWATLQAR